ncbi:MAG: type I-G CRISPR-associated protein Cas8g1/Csx17, partial [Limisphaerales bacterium]
ALLFAAASVRRLEAGEAGVLAYPFCVKQAGLGYASAAGADEEGARAEMWLPLWERCTTLPELSAVLGEGRAQVGNRAARNGVDFTRAVVTLGVDRGLSAFQRFGFQVRNGLAYFATPLERVVVRRNARADLLSEVDAWITRLRDKAGPTAKQPPASVSRSLNQLEGRILELCKHGDAARLQRVLIALGGAERSVARSMRWATETAFLRPLQGLSLRWLDETDTGSREFRLAAALTSLSGSFGKDWLPLRCHLEQVETPRRGHFRWASNASNDVQWSNSPLPDLLNAIFTRRMIRAEKAGTGGLPEIARCQATVGDIAAFIEGETDDDLLADLIWGLSLLDWTVDVPRPPAPEACAPPALYALLKLCFLPPRSTEEAVPLVPAIHRRAAAGDGAAASQLAARRLRASGFAPALCEIPLSGDVVRRTAAALLFPLAPREWTTLREVVLRPAKVARA